MFDRKTIAAFLLILYGHVQCTETMPKIERPPYPESTWYSQPWRYWGERAQRWEILDEYLKSRFCHTRLVIPSKTSNKG